MEKKDWRWRLYKLLVYIDVDCGEQELGFAIGIEGVEKLEKLVEQELDKAREEGRMSAMNELKRAFSKVFYKSGELWFDYLFEDGDTEAEEDAKAVVEGYWEDILSELKDKN